MSLLVYSFRIYARTLRRRPLTTGIAVLSVALGVACSLLLGAFIMYESSFDRFHDHADRLYRVVVETEEPSGIVKRYAHAPYPLAPAIGDVVPGVEEVARITRLDDAELVVQQEPRTEQLIFADESLFDIFSFTVRRGARDLLTRPDAAGVTESAAARLFPNQSPLGKTVTVRRGDTEAEFTVRAVVADPPPTSSLQFDVILPIGGVERLSGAMVHAIVASSWSPNGYRTYVLARTGTTSDVLKAGIDDVFQRHRTTEKEAEIVVQPLADVHFDTAALGSLSVPVDRRFLILLGGIAAILLLAGCINFITLSLARVHERATEVGVRKSLGATPQQVSRQFWSEAAISTACAVTIGVFLAVAALPAFEAMVGRNLSGAFGADVSSTGAALGFCAAVIVGVGLYPSFVLGRLSTASVLRGQRVQQDRRLVTRTLMFAQFVVAIGLVASTVVMWEQLRFVENRGVGFDAEHLIVFETAPRASEYRAFKQEAERLAGIDVVAASMFSYGTTGVPTQVDRGQGTVEAFLNPVGQDYIRAMGIEIVEGRGFDGNEDRSAVLVNEALVRAMGWEHPVGKTVPFAGGGFHSVIGTAKVRGVIRDYNYQSLHHTVQPLVMPSNAAYGGIVGGVTVRFQTPEVMKTALPEVRRVWASTTGRPPGLLDVSGAIAREYEGERRTMNLVLGGALVALFIAAMGVFGLIRLTVSQRMREIGIRRALGATGQSVFRLLAREPAVIVVAATLVCAPAVVLLMQKWLDAFAYRVAVDGSGILAAGLVSLFIAGSATSLVLVRALRENPVQAIRDGV
jgi:putative ABC transport system permease protein